MFKIERENITKSDYLCITAVKSEGRIKRYEVRPATQHGFYRISTDTIEKGIVCFPARMSLDEILADIREAEEE